LKNTFGDDLLALNWRFFATQKTLFNISRGGQLPPRPCLQAPMLTTDAMMMTTDYSDDARHDEEDDDDDDDVHSIRMSGRTLLSRAYRDEMLRSKSHKTFPFVDNCCSRLSRSILQFSISSRSFSTSCRCLATDIINASRIVSSFKNHFNSAATTVPLNQWTVTMFQWFGNISVTA